VLEVVYVTEQVLPLSVQLVALSEPPAELAVQVTVPPGVVGVPPSVSEIVAVQVVTLDRPTGFGAHTTETAVLRVDTVRSTCPELVR